MAKSIYLDYASSARINEANPGAIHELGLKEKQKLEKARKTVAGILGAHADEIIFTSGATESNNLAILGAPRGHIITTNIEHASVLEACRHRGHATFVEVEQSGIVDPKKIKKALRPDTVLVSVMYANNEIGTIQPIREIAKEIRHYNKLKRPDLKNSPRSGLGGRVIFHTDATQAMNYLPINVEKLGVDLMSFNAAKIYGPKGVGVLYKRRKVKLSPIMCGGNQEFGLRPGTENVAGAQALAKALVEAEKIKNKEVKRLTKLRDYFIRCLIRANSTIEINGDLTNRLPNNINITTPNIPSDLLVIELSARGIMASAKSACKAGDGKASHVIKAINPGLKEEDGSVRFSLGRGTTKKDMDDTLKALTRILTKLKKWYY
ncbi:MAG TPA: cysteine desulfurase family protein [Candidatus Paceibacterota bacterium]